MSSADQPKKDETKPGIPEAQLSSSALEEFAEPPKKESAAPPPLPKTTRPPPTVASPNASPTATTKTNTLIGGTAPPPPVAPAFPPPPAAPTTSPSLGQVSPIVPRWCTLSAGIVVVGVATKANTLIGGIVAPPPKLTPAGGIQAVKVETKADPPVKKLTDTMPPSTVSPDGGVIPLDAGDVKPAVNLPPPVIRIPGAALAGGTPNAVPKGGSLLCEVLMRMGAVTQESVDKAIAIQEERGGQIGRILVSIGACSEEAIARALLEQLRDRKNRGGEDEVDISAAARENKDVAGLKVLTRPDLTVAVLVATDVFTLLFAALLASSVHWVRTYSELGSFDFSSWLVVGPSIGMCLLAFTGLELYSPMAKSTPDEIRDIVFSTSLVHLGASLLSTLGDLPIVKWGVFVRSVWWLATMFLVPVVRAIVRGRLSVQSWWGIPVCVLGAAKTGRLIVRTLKAQPRSGLKPVMLLDDDKEKHGTLRASFTNEVMDVYSVNVSAAHFMSESQRKELADDIFGGGDELSGPISSDHIPIVPPAAFSSRLDLGGSDFELPGPDSHAIKPKSVPPTKEASQFPRGRFAEVDGVPIVGDLALAPILAQRLKIPYAVVAMPGVDGPKLLQIIERIGGKFSHLLIIPDLFGFATLGVPAKNLGGILGVEVRQQLLLPGPRLAKRVMDVALTATGILFVLPFLLLIAFLIKLDSKGPIFYTQKRLGKDGEHFRAYKFRTMYGDGEERLKAILDADPALRAEYEIYHKLRRDPRVTRIGRILRKFSLDEFPQLLNVVLGDMSLVGPRPYIERELTEMGGQEKIILRAPPGMTGMWQVSDRNATSFAQRVQIDVYYVRNWSPWLDIHILAKTFGVVIKGTGV